MASIPRHPGRTSTPACIALAKMSSNALVPFVIGVAGDADDLARLDVHEQRRLAYLVKDQVFRVLNDRQRHARWIDEHGAFVAAPRLSAAPLILLTRNRSATDRLVADVAREYAGTAGLELRVIEVVVGEGGGGPDAIVLPGPRGLQGEPARSMGEAMAAFVVARFARLLIASQPREKLAGEIWSAAAAATQRGETHHLVHMALTGRVDDPELLDQLAALPAPLLDVLGAPKGALDLLEPCPVLLVPTEPCELPADGVDERWLTLVAPRLGERGPASPSRAHAYFAYYRETVRHLDGFDADARRWPELPHTPLEELVPSSLATMYATYAHADGLAMHYQKRLQRTRRRIFAWVSLSALGFLGFAHGVDPTHHAAGVIALSIYLLALVLADLCHGRAEHQRVEQRFLDYRALAEALRVAWFWRRSGILRPISRDYLSYQRSELSWLRQAIEALTLRDLATIVDEPHDGNLVDREATLVRWVHDQQAYFAKKLHRMAPGVMRLELGVKVLVLASLAVTAIALFRATLDLHSPPVLGLAVVAMLALALRVMKRSAEGGGPVETDHELAAQHGHGLRIATLYVIGALALVGIGHPFLHWLGSAHDDAHAWWTIAMVIPAVVAGLLHAYAQAVGWSAERRRYLRMEGVFHVALLRLADRTGLQDCPRSKPTRDCAVAIAAAIEPSGAEPAYEAVIEQLGREALAENAEWVMLHRDRPLDLPHAHG